MNTICISYEVDDINYLFILDLVLYGFQIRAKFGNIKISTVLCKNERIKLAQYFCSNVQNELFY